MNPPPGKLAGDFTTLANEDLLRFCQLESYKVQHLCNTS